MHAALRSIRAAILNGVERPKNNARFAETNLKSGFLPALCLEILASSDGRLIAKTTPTVAVRQPAKIWVGVRNACMIQMLIPKPLHQLDPAPLIPLLPHQRLRQYPIQHHLLSVQDLANSHLEKRRIMEVMRMAMLADTMICQRYHSRSVLDLQLEGMFSMMAMVVAHVLRFHVKVPMETIRVVSVMVQRQQSLYKSMTNARNAKAVISI